MVQLNDLVRNRYAEEFLELMSDEEEPDQNTDALFNGLPILNNDDPDLAIFENC